MQRPVLRLRRILISVILLLGISAGGVVGYMWVEGYTLTDAVYMTAITMSTVGYGTIGELSTEGKMFSVALILASAGTFVYAITTLTTFLVEGEMRHIFSQITVNRKVNRLRNHIIICGLGRNGREAAIELLRQHSPFVIIETNQGVIDEFVQTYEQALTIHGDASHEDVLEVAGIRQARGLISSLSSDADNVFITLTARELNPGLRIVARASHESTISKLRRAGASEVILPNLIGGRKMANMITRPALMEFVELISGEGSPDLHLEEISCRNHAKFLGHTLQELGIRAQTGVLVLGRKRGTGNIELNPSVHESLTDEDYLFVMGNEAQFRHFRELYLA